jgi:hypothetical protein
MRRGEKQVEGIYFFEVWSPVVQRSTVFLMMMFSLKLNLVMAQADITAAFLHAERPPGEDIYTHQA